MEEVHEQPLFSLYIDPITKTHLSETARWAKFLAIVGMAVLGLMVVFSVVYSIWISSIVTSLQDRYPSGYNTGIAAGSSFVFFIMALVAFFPLLYMLRFANQMKTALYGNDQERLNLSFQNLKRYFRYVGIITIIAFGLWVIWFFVVGVAFLFIR